MSAMFVFTAVWVWWFQQDGDSGYSPNCLYFSPTLRASPFATNKPTNLGQLAFQQDRGEVRRTYDVFLEH